MANNSTPDVFLLLGLEGGSNIGKGSGLLISTQLKQIMDQVEETITSHLKIKLDQNALSELKAQINGTVAEALTSIKGTPVELTFAFNQDSIDKAFRDVKKQLKEQNITISAQPQEKKQKQGAGSTGSVGGTNKNGSPSFGNIKKEAEDTNKAIKDIDITVEKTTQAAEKLQAVLNRVIKLDTKTLGAQESYDTTLDYMSSFLSTRRSLNAKQNDYIVNLKDFAKYMDKNHADDYGWNAYKYEGEDRNEEVTEWINKNYALYEQLFEFIENKDNKVTGIRIKNQQELNEIIEEQHKRQKKLYDQQEAYNEAIDVVSKHLNISATNNGEYEMTVSQPQDLAATYPGITEKLSHSIIHTTDVSGILKEAEATINTLKSELNGVAEAEKNVVSTTSEVKYALSTLKQSDLPSPSSFESYNAFTSEPYATRMYELMQQRIQQALSAKMQSLTEVIPALPQDSLATIKDQARQKIVAIIEDIPTGIMTAMNSEDAMGNLRSQMADTVNTITKNWLELPEMSSATLEERARAYDEIYSIVKHVFVSSFKMLDLAKSSSLGLSSGDAQLSTSDKMRSLSNAPLMITAESTATREAKQNIEEVTEALQENTEATNENAEAQEELSKVQQRILANAEKTRGRAAAFINQYSNLGQDRYDIEGNVNFEEFEERVRKIRELYSAIRNGEEGFDIAKTMPYGIETYIGALEELIAELNKGEGELREFKNEASNITDDAARMKLEEYTRALRELNNAPGGQQYADTLGANIIPSDLQSEAETLQYVKDHYKDIAEATRNAARETERLNKQYDEEQNNVTQRNKIYQEADNYYKKYQSGIKANITLNQRWLELLEKINTGGFADNQSARRALAELQTATKEANAETMSLWGSLKKLFTDHFGSVSATAAIGTLRNILREAYQNVLDIDKAMTELRKVTNETESTYEAFGQTAANVAQRVGSSVADAINSTADFARLGFDLDQSTALAEAAMVYKNVGDGIEDINEASESIISTIKAFNDIDASDAMSIIDKFNEVGNNYAISSEGIGIALQKSAAALASANNTLDESIALITAGKQHCLTIWKHIERIHLTALIA